jgi:CRP-like cAMP-binding protein
VHALQQPDEHPRRGQLQLQVQVAPLTSEQVRGDGTSEESEAMDSPHPVTTVSAITVTVRAVRIRTQAGVNLALQDDQYVTVQTLFRSTDPGADQPAHCHHQLVAGSGHRGLHSGHARTALSSGNPADVRAGEPNGAGAKKLSGAPAEAARRNAILAGLADDELAALLPHLEDVPLTLGDVLYEGGRPVGAVHFPTVGVISLVHQLAGGEVVEIATVGREGMAGISVFLGAAAPVESALVQVSGRALRMDATRFRQEIATLDGPLQRMLRRYAQAMFTQLGRNAACNRVHSTRQRAARWLLMTADRMGSPTFDLTQEFLAQMLAVRRASVSEVASTLADDGCITYSRGTITITDPDGLHRNACECYDLITSATEQALRGR